MPSYLPIGLGAGLAAAVLFASAVIGQTALGFFLMLIVPLPKFLAGLGWGWPAALVAAVTATVMVGVVANVQSALYYGVSQGLPAAWLCYLAYLNRPAPSDPARPDPAPPQSPAVEWYPVGRILAWAAAIAGALAALFLLLLGTTSEALRTQMRRVMEAFAKSIGQVDDKAAANLDIAAMTEVMINLMPAAFAASALFGIVFNLWLAGRITLASGRLLRPWPDLAALTLPPGSGLALAAATLLALPSGLTGMGEYPRLLAAGFASAIMLAYVLVGLAILHHTTRGKPWRGLALSATYAALLVLNPWSGLLLALVGLSEPFAPWRRQPAAASPPPAPPPGPPTT